MLCLTFVASKVAGDLADGCVTFLCITLAEYAPESEPLLRKMLGYWRAWEVGGERPRVPHVPSHNFSLLVTASITESMKK